MDNELMVRGQNILMNRKSRFEELFDSFAAYADVSESTLQTYTVCIRKFLAWMAENGVSDPGRGDIAAYRDYLETLDIRDSTKNEYLSAVKLFFSWLCAEDIIDKNPAARLRVKQNRTGRAREAFSESDIRTILSSIDTGCEIGARDYAMILLSVTCGLRINEMRLADIGDIETIRGRRVLYIQGKGHSQKDASKTLIDPVWTAILDYLKFRKHRSKKDPLFTGCGSRSTGRLRKDSISKIIKKRLREAGFDSSKYTAHSLRHTSITLLLKSGADLYTAQKHARHLDPKTTEIYLHLAEDDAQTTEQAVFDYIFTDESN